MDTIYFEKAAATEKNGGKKFFADFSRLASIRRVKISVIAGLHKRWAGGLLFLL